MVRAGIRMVRAGVRRGRPPPAQEHPGNGAPAAPVAGIAQNLTQSACFQVAVDGLADDVADFAVLELGQPPDALVGVIVDAQAQPAGVP